MRAPGPVGRVSSRAIIQCGNRFIQEDKPEELVDLLVVFTERMR